ncbi:MAG: hypothetical protein MJ188_09880 [Treponema sp.]|nr:hypothetical protein [Treponema sp.]
MKKNGNIICIKKCTNKTTGSENSDYEESKIEEESVLKIFSRIYEFLNRGSLELCDLPLIGGDSVSCELEFSSKQKISVPGGITFKGLFDESLWSFRKRKYKRRL